MPPILGLLVDFDNSEVESDDSSSTKFDIASLVLFQTNKKEGMCVVCSCQETRFERNRQDKRQDVDGSDRREEKETTRGECFGC